MGRLPLGVTTLALFFGTQATTGSLETASTVSAAAMIGMAAGAPLQGQLLDRFAKPVVIVCFTVLQVATFVALAVAVNGGSATWTLAVLALCQGMTIPSLPSCTRLVLKRAVSAGEVDAAFALDTTLMEVIYVSGPAIAAGVTATWGPQGLFLGCAVLVAAGTIFFVRVTGARWLGPDPGQAERAPDKEDLRPRPHDSRHWLPAGGFVLAMALLAAPFGLIECALTQFGTEQGTGLSLTGLILSVTGLGSIAGGLAYGTVRWRTGPARRFVVLVLGQGAAITVVAVLPSLGVVWTGLTLAALCTVPLASICFHMLDLLSPPGIWMRMQSWGAVANTGGHAAGVTLGGYIATAYGSGATFALVGLCAFLAIMAAMPALLNPSVRRPEPAKVGAHAE
ncbi:MFS transporter [Nonomuraea sp. NPDC000554]|uniref:MFS transporter n=1 Tax=Nonomuraea sp. NPDC000554 TaxID=3154259 RepID=UPI003328724C